MSEKKRGSVLVEACVALPVALVLFFGVGRSAAFFLWRSWIDVDAFTLARAHLYGNQRELCRPGGLARRLAWRDWRADYSCEGSGVVRYRVAGVDDRVSHGLIDLRRGRFSREGE